MRLVIEIDMDNAAFTDEDNGEPCQGPEVARILREYADRVDLAAPLEEGDNGRLRDYNGNTCGTWKVSAWWKGQQA